MGEMGGTTPAYPNRTPPPVQGSGVPMVLITLAKRLFSSASLFYAASFSNQKQSYYKLGI